MLQAVVDLIDKRVLLKTHPVRGVALVCILPQRAQRKRKGR